MKTKAITIMLTLFLMSVLSIPVMAQPLSGGVDVFKLEDSLETPDWTRAVGQVRFLKESDVGLEYDIEAQSMPGDTTFYVYVYVFFYDAAPPDGNPDPVPGFPTIDLDGPGPMPPVAYIRLGAIHTNRGGKGSISGVEELPDGLYVLGGIIRGEDTPGVVIYDPARAPPFFFQDVYLCFPEPSPLVFAVN